MDALPAELELAVHRFNRQEDRRIRDAGEGSSTRMMALTQRWIEPVISLLRERLQEVCPVTLVLRELEIGVLGVCLLQSVLHSIAKGEHGVRDVALYLGMELHRQCWAAGLLKHDRGLAKRVEAAARLKHGSVAYRSQAARSMAAREGYRQRRWSNQQIASIGGWGIDVLLEALPEVFVLDKPVYQGDEGHITITEAAMAFAEDAVAAAVLSHPVWLPITEPPVPWTGEQGGGSPDNRTRRYAKVVRSHDKVRNRAVAHAISTGQMQPALDALNTLQSVPWTINRTVLAFQQWVWHARVKLPGFPPRDELPLPEHGPWDEMSEAEQKAWKVRASAVKRDNRTYRCDRLSVLEDLHTALDLKRSERFYTPMNMDWRGRVYPMSHFNYQREDRVRALFLFADGEPIGDDGLYWLKVHLANLSDGLGQHWSGIKPSKLSFEERVKWVDQNIKTIKWIAMVAERLSAPQLIVSYLSLLEEPFLWLAAAIELNSALATTSIFVTRLPIAFDGSCSGLQHLCAMTRAPEGSLVNLTPTSVPQDVYQVVADRVAAAVRCDAAQANSADTQVIANRVAAQVAADVTAKTCQTAGGACVPELAKLAQAHGITRSLVKRNVMTYSYSSKPFGMAQQHEEDLMEPLRRRVTLGELDEHPFGDKTLKASIYLAHTTYRAIEEVVHLPAKAMAFLQRLARVLAHEGKPLRWTTPVGLPWINRYCEHETTRVALWLHDRGVRVRYCVKLATGEDKRGIDKESAANGVAPNFVHALDAAHLLLTTLAARDCGITALATVHDSFGCSASRAGVFRDVIRREFVRLYQTHDPLAEVLEQAKHDLTDHNRDKCPELPTYGPLIIEEVLNAEYCFA